MALEALIANLMAPAHRGRMVSPKYQGKHPMTPEQAIKLQLGGEKRDYWRWEPAYAGMTGLDRLSKISSFGGKYGADS